MPAQAIDHGTALFDKVRDELIWNARLSRSRSPDRIIRPVDVEQVRALVVQAAQDRQHIGLLSGGHNYEASALRDGGILLDLGALNAISIDAHSRTAWIGPGVRGRQLIDALAPQQLAFPVGHCADVGLGGYLLCGGFGWNMGEWGPACASVLEVEAVLASGELVRASATQHSELFWAACGAGPGFFAVATGFRIALQQLPAAVFAFTASFHAASAPALASWLDEAVGKAARAAEITCLVGPHRETGAPAIVLRAEAVGDSPERAREQVAPLLDLPVDAVRIEEPSERYLEFAELTELSVIPGHKRVAVDHIWSAATIGDLMLAVHHLAGMPCKMSTVNLFALGGVGQVRHPPDERVWALSVGGSTAAGIYGVWDNPSDDARHMDWVAQVDRALAPFRAARYVGEASLTRSAARVSECFTVAALERIEGLRARYDPTGMIWSFPDITLGSTPNETSL